MAQLSVERTPLIIAAEINTINQQAEKILLISAIEIGKRLKEAKALVPHGEWGKWLGESVNYSQRTADKLMQLFNGYGHELLVSSDDDGSSNSPPVANLSYSKALILLGIPEEERERFVQDNDVVSMTKQELQEAVKEKKQALRERDEANQERERTIQKNTDLQRELDNKNSTITKLTTQNTTLEKEVSVYKQISESRQENVTQKQTKLGESTEEFLSARKITDAQFNIHRDNMINAYQALLKTLAALAETDPELKEEYRKMAHGIVENMAKRLIVYPPSITTNLNVKKITTTL
ncbi:hypothetical protein SDC9_22123 [bioreactor metagenome]|uniref:DUF3102 domain-containing protein n=1 Tax=bioreactor metagenome TaxID=1076179 RepID=A0A644UBF0_9ZZZZ|nr:DUF3102 domain-containing protein [Desulfitobacterium hafniense]MEA5025596.1 DUF3102 domain-containing protein [Desulfitobacterium hafniense]